MTLAGPRSVRDGAWIGFRPAAPAEGQPCDKIRETRASLRETPWLELRGPMKKLFSTPVLSFLAGACAMACVVLCWMQIQYTRQVREIQNTQRQWADIQRHQAMMNRLVVDLYAYSETNAAIRPLLESVGIPARQP